MKRCVLLLLLTLLASCSDDGTNPGTDPETAAPKIESLTADKAQILYGGKDPAVITCSATGGNLSYLWEVDLGDIIPLNPSRSKVSFNGSACCVGEKIITCTVSNSLGSDSKTIIITILEEIKAPEIITVDKDKSEIRVSAGESAAFVCYAIGGNLGYTWESDCGSMTVDEGDRSKATFTATRECVGVRNITCSVANEKGVDQRTVQLVVSE